MESVEEMAGVTELPSSAAGLPSDSLQPKLSDDAKKVIAACVGAMTTSLIMTPFDVVKTRLQTQADPEPLFRPSARLPQSEPPTFRSDASTSQVPARSSATQPRGSTCCQKTFFITNAAEDSLLCKFDPRISTAELPASGQHSHRSTAPVIAAARSLQTGATSSSMTGPAQRAALSFAALSKSFSPLVGSAQPTHVVQLAGAAACTFDSPASATLTLEQNRGSSHFSGFFDAIRKISRYEGISTLWRGVGTTLAMSVPTQIVYMVGYDKLRASLLRSAPRSTSNDQPAAIYLALAPLAAGMSSRAAVATMFSPMELVRTRLQSVPSSPDSSTLQVIRTAWRNTRTQGLSSLWRGLPSTLWRDVPFSGIYWASYEGVKRIISGKGMGEALDHAQPGVKAKGSKTFTVAFVSGATSGMVAATLTNPFDVIKTRQQASSAAATKGTVTLLVEIARKEGWQGLSKGLTPRLAKVVPACGVMIGAYEIVSTISRQAALMASPQAWPTAHHTPRSRARRSEDEQAFNEQQQQYSIRPALSAMVIQDRTAYDERDTVSPLSSPSRRMPGDSALASPFGTDRRNSAASTSSQSTLVGSRRPSAMDEKTPKGNVRSHHPTGSSSSILFESVPLSHAHSRTASLIKDPHARPSHFYEPRSPAMSHDPRDMSSLFEEEATAVSEEARASPAWRDRAWLLLHAGGLMSMYALYSVLQERIMKSEYGPEQQRFTAPSLLIACNRSFSLLVGLLLTLISPSSRSSQPERTYWQRLQPQHAITAYALVAACNFASTYSQYEALKYLSFTTQSIAKCAKMVFVLLVGSLVYKRQHIARKWVAGATVLLGCAVYLLSRPQLGKAAGYDRLSGDRSSLDKNIRGTLCIFAYLLFDSLTSTTQERTLGTRARSLDGPFARGSAVLDQMVYVNAISTIIAAAITVLQLPSGLMVDINLIARTPALIADMVALAFTATFGLLILFNTLANYGALTTALIMTLRHFLSIVLNAALFDNVSTIGPLGWMGIAFVASGVFIDRDNRFDDLNERRFSQGTAQYRKLETQSLDDRAQPDRRAASWDASRDSSMRLVKQYAAPLFLPLLIGIALYGVPMPRMSPATRPSQPNLNTSLASSTVALSAETGETKDPIVHNTAAVEGSRFGQQFHDKIDPNCSMLSGAAVKYPESSDAQRTIFSSFPRSGNTYVRSLVERASGYQTSSIYCDRPLAKTFHGECDSLADNTYFVKSHYPWGRDLPESANVSEHWQAFDRNMRIIRNPLDVIYSFYNFQQTKSHTGRIENLAPFGQADQVGLQRYIHGYNAHARYWAEAPIREHLVRYEDLRSQPLPTLLGMLSFLLPPERMPSIERIACAIERDPSKEAYHSAKHEPFYSWDHFEDETRAWLLEQVRAPWCKYGFETLAREHNRTTHIDCTPKKTVLRHRTIPKMVKHRRKDRKTV
ncbi:uncharacterized protein L969DRAFT_619488 [Mixia osmundae IAM 14324]|uniref:Sulfotransferase domain-containing protein n=1 Tax=Mixia osmundae (strain CBS 9802 / IAM 14324 / JCM 22182 / KY 12970) TaxID=764103 RepID=G7E9L1_MIXOS|nr:uncharacterized protein L969DRAFT_619488 [Mixia osmundae IAM 14324]KEI39961.1 hypothetical protein L969DRAFT_619488 [Mixia osmundae IAM 14324]GAA99330.1 hypothetical protein E5Q_06025 [Mixia osmundae IAM 14324]